MIGLAVPRFAGYPLSTSIPLTALCAPASCKRAEGEPLRIHRQFGPEFTPSGSVHWRHTWHDDGGGVSLQVGALAPEPGCPSTRYLLRAPDQADFILDLGEGRIDVIAPAALAQNTLEHLLLDQALPRLLAGRGHLVAHASIVQLSQGAVAFIGRSGWGKSTLAALLHRRGFPALCDDCALFERRGDTVYAIPSYPGLRLFEDSIEQSMGTETLSSPVSDYSDKQRIIEIDHDAMLEGPRPLAAICVLDAPDPAITIPAIAQISAAAACMAIIEHGFRLDPSDSTLTARQLAQASTIAHAVPAYALTYPRDFASQDALIATLLSRFNASHKDAP